MLRRAPRFCVSCGERLVRKWIPQEGRRRPICPRCKTIAYENPKVLVTTIVANSDQVLLCQRVQSPARNRWSAPTGFAECGETLEEAAVREIREETGLRIAADRLSLYGVTTLEDICQVYIAFRVEVDNVELERGPECKDVRFFSETQLPWERLAYPEMIGFFRLFFRERHSGAQAIHLTHLKARRIVRKSYKIAAVESRVEADRPPKRRSRGTRATDTTSS
jgi:ADP-ribose pyrophosphatase YjhB (NUDIX family)